MLIGIGNVFIYFIIVASLAILCRFLIKIPNELFRKILHTILLGSLLVFVFGFQIWWHAALTAVIFAIVVYPVLIYLERLQHFSEVTTERKKGELKSSLLLVFSMFAIIICICWGWFKDRYLVLAAVYAWGFGDAAAALVGKKFGKHKLNGRYLDGKKSLEGSIAMFIISVVSVAIVIFFRGGLSNTGYVMLPILTAFVSTLSELYSKEGMDTIICPICSMIILIPLMYLFGGLT